MCTANRNAIVAVVQTTQRSRIAVAVDNACAAFVNVTNEPIPKKLFLANIVNATISHANAIRGCCVVDHNMVRANVANAVAIPAGRAMIAHAAIQPTHAYRPVAVKFARGMANVCAVHANAKRPPTIGIPENTVTNAQHAQADAKSSKTVCNAKFSKRAQWAIILTYAQPTVQSVPHPSMLKLLKSTPIKAITSAHFTMKTIVNSNSFITTMM